MVMISMLSQVMGSRRCRAALLAIAFHALLPPQVHGQAPNCTIEASAVFNQALSTHRAVLVEVLAAKRRGRWQPDGTFRAPFFSRNARTLRDIRHLLTRDDIDESALLKTFRRLLNTSLPQGVTLPRALRMDERERFQESVDAYVSCRNRVK